MDRKILFGFVFLLLISFSTAITQTGYIGNYQLNEWNTSNQIENVSFVGGDNKTLYLSLPKYSNVSYSHFNISSEDALKGVYIEVGTPDGNRELELSEPILEQYINTSEDYYLLINANSVNNNSLTGCTAKNIFGNTWLVYVDTNNYELSRASLFEELFRPSQNNNASSSQIITIFNGINEISSPDERDINKRVHYAYVQHTTSNKDDYELQGTFSNTTHNYNVSSWSYVYATGAAGPTDSMSATWEIPDGTSRNTVTGPQPGSTSNDEYGDDLTADQYDNPNDALLTLSQNGGFQSVTGIVTSIIIANDEISWIPFNNPSLYHYYDFLINGSVPEISSTTGKFALNKTLDVDDFENSINNYLPSCLPDGGGNCNVPILFHSDSAGILSADISSTINYSLQYNFTYTPSTYENENNQYELLVYSPSPTGVDSIFYFNNTGYNPLTFSYGDGYKKMNYSFNTPFEGDGVSFNAPMFWSVDDNGNLSNTSTYNQTVNRLNLAKCTDQPTWKEVINILTLDEEDNSTGYINTTINLNANIWYTNENILQNFSFKFENDYNYSICIYPNSTGYVNAIMEYYSTGYSNRKYYLDNYPIDSNSSKQLLLYNLNSSKASDITLYVYDRNTGESVEGAFVKILRYYPETGNYRTVEIERTDSNGFSLGKMVVADVFYKFIVEYNRGVVLDSSVERIVSLTKQLPVTISGDLLESWRSIDDISGSVTCTESTRVCRFTWSDSSNIVQTATMKVYRVNGYGKTAISEQSETAVSGSIVYEIIENVTGNEYIAVGYIHTNTTNSFYTLGQDFIEFRQSMADQFGVGALLPMFFLLIIMGAILLNTGAVGVVVGSLIAIVGGTLIGIIPFGITTIISFVIMGGILIGKLKS